MPTMKHIQINIIDINHRKMINYYNGRKIRMATPDAYPRTQAQIYKESILTSLASTRKVNRRHSYNILKYDEPYIEISTRCRSLQSNREHKWFGLSLKLPIIKKIITKKPIYCQLSNVYPKIIESRLLDSRSCTNLKPFHICFRDIIGVKKERSNSLRKNGASKSDIKMKYSCTRLMSQAGSVTDITHELKKCKQIRPPKIVGYKDIRRKYGKQVKITGSIIISNTLLPPLYSLNAYSCQNTERNTEHNSPTDSFIEKKCQTNCVNKKHRLQLAYINNRKKDKILRKIYV